MRYSHTHQYKPLKRLIVKDLKSLIWLCLLTNVAAANGLLTSEGAWTITGVVPTSNAGQQTNTANQVPANQFNNFGGPVACLNSEHQSIDMQASPQNLHPNYTAGHTYNYQATAVAANASHSNQQIAVLLADGVPIPDTRITGPNHSGIYGPSDKKTISGGFTVKLGDPIIGKRIGMRISSAGKQTRFIASESTYVSVTKSSVSEPGSERILFDSDFTEHSKGNIFDKTSEIPDMALSYELGASYIRRSGGYLRINNNEITIQTVGIVSETVKFNPGCNYKITFSASRRVTNDPQQTQLRVALGSYTTEFTIAENTTSFSFDVSADTSGIAGELFEIRFSAAAPTSTGDRPNQYWIESLNITEKNRI